MVISIMFRASLGLQLDSIVYAMVWTGSVYFMLMQMHEKLRYKEMIKIASDSS